MCERGRSKHHFSGGSLLDYGYFKVIINFSWFSKFSAPNKMADDEEEDVLDSWEDADESEVYERILWVFIILKRLLNFPQVSGDID